MLQGWEVCFSFVAPHRLWNKTKSPNHAHFVIKLSLMRILVGAHCQNRFFCCQVKCDSQSFIRKFNLLTLYLLTICFPYHLGSEDGCMFSYFLLSALYNTPVSQRNMIIHTVQMVGLRYNAIYNLNSRVGTRIYDSPNLTQSSISCDMLALPLTFVNKKLPIIAIFNQNANYFSRMGLALSL